MTFPEPHERIHRHIEHLERDFASQDFQLLSDNEQLDLSSKLFGLIRDLNKSYQIGIVTALPKEYAAVKAMLDETKDYIVPGDPNIYVIGTIPALPGNKKHLIVATLLVKMGNNSAANAATNLLRSFPGVNEVLMVGIAGGIPNPNKPDIHVRLGDVVVSHERGVVQYDMQKITKGEIEVRDTSTPPSARMTRLVNLLEAKRLAGEHPWEDHIIRGSHIEGAARPGETTDILYNAEDKKIEHPKDIARRNRQPKIHNGLIGSANTLLKDMKRRDLLRDNFGARAIEMEGSGIADGTWSHGAYYILIRGICDYCDNHKNNLWQGYAAVVAAAYARALLEILPLD